MAKLSVILDKGITIGDVTHKDVELKELTVGDILKAEEYAEEMRVIGGQAVLVSSPSKLGMEMLRLQIAKLGGLQMPLSAEEFSLLSRTDLMLIRKAAQELDKVAYVKVSERGRDNQGASGNLPSA